MKELIRIHPRDNVAVALSDLAAGVRCAVDGGEVVLEAAIPRGHKVALWNIACGEEVIKYGHPIGRASASIPAGQWVHTHNLRTSLSGILEYSWKRCREPLVPEAPQTFSGYERPDGTVGVRNEVWIVPTVGCVNDIARRLARQASEALPENVGGVYAWPHPYGCSQLGDDAEMTRRILAGLVRHPNAAGVLVLGLGCESNTLEKFKEVLGPFDAGRVKFLIAQDVEDELAAGLALLGELIERASGFVRSAVPVSRLCVGLKCGGSDGLSGVTANPLLGRFSDRLIAQGGSVLLTEVPEMFGAETILLGRCVSREVFERTAAMVNDFKEYFQRYGQPVYENPSPGNKAGGITTLEEKSLGCVQKGGTAPVVDVLEYGQSVSRAGLTLLSAPGNDLVSSTAMVAAGAHLVLFTTGRGTPWGTAAPTIKVSTHSSLARRKPHWIDFNAGVLAEGATMAETAERFWEVVVETASGKTTCDERNDYREIAIFRDGVTL